MTTRRLFMFALVGLLSLASAARAQDITVFVGGVFPGNGTVHNVPTSLDRGPIFGVRLSSPFAAFLKLEGSLALSNDYLFPHDIPGVTSAKGILVNANLLANIPLGKTVPYVTAGLGLIHQYGSSDLPVGTKFAVNYGGGLKIPRLFGPAGLRFDARGYTAGLFSHYVNMFELSGGVLFSF